MRTLPAPARLSCQLATPARSGFAAVIMTTATSVVLDRSFTARSAFSFFGPERNGGKDVFNFVYKQAQQIRYTLGTANVTNGSNAAAGSGTFWNSEISVGDAFKVADETAVYTVTGVTDGTHLTLTAIGTACH